MSTEKYDFERYLNVRLFHDPSFSPDGNLLSFLTNITGVDEVWSVPVELQTQCPSWPGQLTFRGERFVSATFSPKEDILLVSGDVGGNERKQLYTLSADGSLFISLTKQPDVMHLFGGWSPDGTRVTYSSNERDQRYFDVYEHHIASGEVKRVFRQDGTNHVLKYSPDGQQVLVSHYESNVCNQLLLVDVVTGDVEALTAETNALPSLYSSAEWSAAGDGLTCLP